MLNWETAPFTDVRTAALNVERQYRDKKRSVVKEVGVFYSQEAPVGPSPGRGCGRGRPNFRGGYQGNQKGPRVRVKNNYCYACGESGHWSNECPQNNKCYLCGDLGHWAKDCQNKVKSLPQSPTAPPIANFTVTNPFTGNKE